jgi:hypothetical protein
MGHEWVDFTVRAKLSRHNSAQDDHDDERWAELRRLIEELCKQFNDIDAEAYS